VTRQLQGIDADHVIAGDVRLLMDGIPQLGVSGTSGPKGVLKTTFMCHLAAQVTNGALPCGRRRVIYMPGEDMDLATGLKPRLMAAGADTSLIKFFPDPRSIEADGKRLMLPEDFGLLDEFVGSVPDTSLLIIDPLSTYVPGYTSPRTARTVMTQLASLSVRHECAIHFSHEWTKSPATLEAAVAGARAIVLAARATFVFGPAAGQALDDEDASTVRVWANSYCSVGPKPAARVYEQTLRPVAGVGQLIPCLNHVRNSDTTDEDIFATYRASQTKPRVGEVERAKRWLLQMLSQHGGEIRTKPDLEDAALADDFAWRTVQRARAILAQEGLIETIQRVDGSRGHWVRLRELFTDVEPDEIDGGQRPPAV
jgi:hypothetical protein